MKDEKYIASLFDSAKNEAPKLSYQEVAERFTASVVPASTMEWVKNFFGKLNLNSIIMISIGSLIITSILILTNSAPEAERYAPVMDKMEVENVSSETPLTTLINTENASIENKELTTQQAEATDFINVNEPIFESDENLFAQRIAFENDMVAIQPLALPNLLSLDFESDTIPIPQSPDSEDIAKAGGMESCEEINYNSSFPLGYSSDIVKGKYGKWKSYTKKFEKEMELPPDGLTAIKSEWGNIEVKTWSQSNVKFDVLVTLETDKPKKAEEVLKNINVVFKNTSQGISAETVVRKKKAIGWSNRKNWEAKIDYVVYVPASSNLKIDHFYGDVTVGNLKGAASFDLFYSDLNIGCIGDNSKLKLRNGNASIGKSGDLKTALYFAKVKIDKAGHLVLDNNHGIIEAASVENVSGKSHWSTYKFGDIEHFEFVGTGDKIFLNNAGNFKLNLRNAAIEFKTAKNLEGEFVHTKIMGEKLEDVVMNFNHGSFEVQEVGNIKTVSHWGKMKLGSIGDFENNTIGTKVEIAKARSVKAAGRNSQMDIGTIAEKLDLDLTFGGCTASILDETPEISLNGSNANFKLIVPKAAQFSLNVSSNIKNYYLPKNIQTSREIEKVGTYQIEGHFGNEGANNQVQAKLTFGKLNLKTE